MAEDEKPSRPRPASGQSAPGEGSEDKRSTDKPANVAPDAVKDPSEKTDGKPGLPPSRDGQDDADPGGG